MRLCEGEPVSRGDAEDAENQPCLPPRSPRLRVKHGVTMQYRETEKHELLPPAGPTAQTSRRSSSMRRYASTPEVVPVALLRPNLSTATNLENRCFFCSRLAARPSLLPFSVAWSRREAERAKKFRGRLIRMAHSAIASGFVSISCEPAHEFFRRRPRERSDEDKRPPHQSSFRPIQHH